jgi:hypothetical protein
MKPHIVDPSLAFGDTGFYAKFISPIKEHPVFIHLNDNSASFSEHWVPGDEWASRKLPLRKRFPPE